MITNLQDFFRSDEEIFLDTIQYQRIDNPERKNDQEYELLCQDSMKVTLLENGVRVIVRRDLFFEPKEIFSLNVSFGMELLFNERKGEVDWGKVNLVEVFRENGDFAIQQLMSRISLLVGEITASFGQQPIILPAMLAKKFDS
uniref:Preprotein translocase subunit SecB n=1 Tax=Eubacterium cellulosolvens (strain ATCC 43171 / JCM 9499 / 6) TaxID=633697 RepID=I5AWF4_EUBC6